MHPSLGETLSEMDNASAVRSVSACAPEAGRERKRLAGRLWFNMGARSNNRAAPAKPWNYILDPAPFLMVVEVGKSTCLCCKQQ